MIPLLGPTDPFPRVERALRDPNGLLAAGGGLGVARLVDAYSRGIFPWFGEGDPVLWWCPEPRMVLDCGKMHISRSLERRLRKRDYELSMDRAFDQVLDACAAPRNGQPGTWLVPQMMRAYARLFEHGYAHSVEVWIDGALAGGLYGVAIGRVFFGESMFSRRPDGSKIALAFLSAQLARWEFPIIDCQMQTPHLESLGAREMPRREFVKTVEALVGADGPPVWRFDPDLDALPEVITGRSGDQGG